jgi:septation ring formation regulator EzrA
MESLKKRRDPLCFIEVIDVPLGIDPHEIEEKVEQAYADIQDGCETGKYVPISTQQTVHTYAKLDKATGTLEEHIVFVLTAHIISHEELSKRQRLAQLGGAPNPVQRG